MTERKCIVTHELFPYSFIRSHAPSKVFKASTGKWLHLIPIKYIYMDKIPCWLPGVL